MRKRRLAHIQGRRSFPHLGMLPLPPLDFGRHKIETDPAGFSPLGTTTSGTEAVDFSGPTTVTAAAGTASFLEEAASGPLQGG